MSRETDVPATPTTAMAEGGPWGSKDEDTGTRGGREGSRNPWTPPPQGDPGRGPERGPSAFDELLRRARDTLGGGGGFGEPNHKRLIAIGVGLALAAWFFFTAIHNVGEKQRGVVSFMGSYSRTLGPGMNFTLPAPLETVEVISVGEIRNMDLGSGSGEKLVLTGDQNLLNLSYAVRWNVSNARQFAFQIAEPEDTIKQVADSAMRGVIANVVLTDAMGSGRRTIEQQVQQRMQEILDGYGAGIRIEGVAINKADPPNEVITAFKEVTAAQQDFDTYINRANAYAQQIAALSTGEATAFDKVYEQYKLAPEVTRRRMYYEAMEAVLKDVNKTVIETNGVTPYLALPPPAAPRAALDNNITVTGAGR